MYEKLNESARRVLFYAGYEASQLGSPSIGTEHILLGLVKDSSEIIQELFSRARVPVKLLQAEIEAAALKSDKATPSVEPPFSDDCKRALQYAVDEAKKLFHNYVGTEHLLLGLLRFKESTAGRLLYQKGMDLYSVREDVISILQRRNLARKRKDRPLLNEFSRNFNTLARQGAFDPLIGRSSEIDRIIQVLSRRRKNNPVLIGEPGVGKTAIVEGLAQKINDGDVPPSLADKQVVALDLSLIVAGTKYRGQFEERLKGILKELMENRDLIVFIDEIHNLIGAGSAEGSLDAASILKPALSRGELQCVGSTTLRDYHRYIEKDRALVRRFQPIKVSPPTADETLSILHGIKERYERFHRVRYSADALKSAVFSSNRYITDRSLPDKAIDVLDEAGARVKLRHGNALRAAALRVPGGLGPDVEDDGLELASLREESDGVFTLDADSSVPLSGLSLPHAGPGGEAVATPVRPEAEIERVVEREDIEEVISSWTGVPITTIKKEESERLLQIENYLHLRVIGQDNAISALARAIRRSRSGIKNPDRPVGSFMFLGPTGVGKTEVAKTVAEFLFHDEKSLIRFDMSEYMEKHAVARMIGSPPGYVGHEEGGILTKVVKRNPYSVVLLDEIEKAHTDVLNILLQVLEDGQITDAFGDTIDFRNSMIIMTSNIGSRELDSRKVPGFKGLGREVDYRERREIVLKELKRVLAPEFINRIDDILIFDPLSDENLLAIARLLVKKLNVVLEARNVQISLDEAAYRWLVERCCGDRSYGARPLRRGIQRHIEDVVSERLIQDLDSEEKVLRITVENGELLFETESERFAAAQGERESR